ncbi:bifunctional enoyl-CoA hydratase/phosphate acetyltransferase [Bauldia sp.]|uniref:bifunctional enoyl-CoA hydratase/phosphate acetyltransferase n=1 Tax=Bauldia sp. TaxID=2575872 RepID=UPI003BAAAC50
MTEFVENKTLSKIKVGDTASLKRTLKRRNLNVWVALTGNPGLEGDFVAEHGVTIWASSLFATLVGGTLPGPGSVIRTATVSFHQPVHFDEEVTATVTVEKIDKKGGIVDLACKCVNDAGDLIVDGSIHVAAPTKTVRLPKPAHMLGDLVEHSRGLHPMRTAVVHPCTTESLLGAIEAKDHGLIEPILFAPPEALKQAAATIGVDIGKLQVVATDDADDSAGKAAAMAGAGDVQALMKGSLHTDQFLHAILAKENRLRTDRLLSHCSLMALPTYARHVIISDAVINIAPDVDQKKDIIQNAIILARAIGIDQPKVAVLSAVEMVRPRMASTMDAAVLAKMADRGQIVGGIVDGPLDLDIAVDAESARVKGVQSPVAGAADILIAPDIDAGNMMYKELSFMSEADVAGVVVGARVPVILTSRSDNADARLYSTALAVLFAEAIAKDPALLHPDTSE